jgi:DNA-binding response OmpR family regulator
MKRRILLVDDDLPVLLTLKAVLEMHGFEVQTSTSAAGALEKLNSATYQMVITDVRMETDDAGFRVIQAARQQPYDPATALLTAFPPDDGARIGEAQSLLVKPVGTDDLVRQLESLLVQHEDEKQRRAGTVIPLRDEAVMDDGTRRLSANGGSARSSRRGTARSGNETRRKVS